MDAGGSSSDGAELAGCGGLDGANLENHLLVGKLSQTPAEADTEELKKLRKERDSLKKKLAESESKQANNAADDKSKDELDDASRWPSTTCAS